MPRYEFMCETCQKPFELTMEQRERETEEWIRPHSRPSASTTDGKGEEVPTRD
jgi:hypothetical protein